MNPTLPNPDTLDDATAQDVIDALRLACMAQDDDAKVAALLRTMLELAPETSSNRGIQLLLDLIAEGSLRVEMVDHPRTIPLQPFDQPATSSPSRHRPENIC